MYAWFLLYIYIESGLDKTPRRSVYACFLAVVYTERVCILGSYCIYTERVYMLGSCCIYRESMYTWFLLYIYIKDMLPSLLLYIHREYVSLLLYIHKEYVSFFVYTIRFHKQIMLLTSSLRGLECPL
jgi:hypothetical protein